MKAYRDEADRLGDTLGDAHDLAVFEGHVDRLSHAVLDAETALQLGQLAADRRGELDTVALGVAQLFYREKPKALVKRIKGYHKVWCDLPREQLAAV
jgi:hypothetical protein